MLLESWYPVDVLTMLAIVKYEIEPSAMIAMPMSPCLIVLVLDCLSKRFLMLFININVMVMDKYP